MVGIFHKHKGMPFHNMRYQIYLISSKDTKMELLVEHLNSYAKNGIPNSQVYPQGQCESIDALYKLETDWKETIDHKGK